MKLAVRGKSKLGFVDGSCVKSMYRGELAEQWEKCNAIVLNCITKARDKFYNHLLFENELDILVPKPGCGCEESRPSLEYLSQQRLLQFLMGLNESYSNMRINVLMKRLVVTVNEAYAIVTQEERQRALGVADMNKDPLTMMAGKPRYNRPKKIGMICEHCGYKGHLKENCYKIVGYPADFKSKKKTHVAGGSRIFTNNANAEEISNSEGQPQGHYLIQEQFKQLVGLLLNKPTSAKCSTNMVGIVSLMSNATEKDWIVDTGATHHITCNKDLLDTLKIIGGYRSVQLPTGKTSNITHTGNAQILGNQKVNRKVLGIGREHKGLYIIKQRDAENKALVAGTIANEGAETCDSLLASYGIIHQTSCPYTSQQNRNVERKLMHILEVARSLKFQSGVPIRYWGDCVKTAVYVINRLPTPVLKGRTPYELLYGKEPEVDHLRDDIDSPANDHAPTDLEQGEVATIPALLEHMDLTDTLGSALKEGSEEALHVELVIEQVHAPPITNLSTQPVQR
ncbi:uncharacterized protein [Nicotiana tomentosiformis]|uniref:uncharacterized protein n=1 Tax=Nicotiana tomentosiformis TaxID=4098 RepID=UPI00388CB42B